MVRTKFITMMVAAISIFGSLAHAAAAVKSGDLVFLAGEDVIAQVKDVLSDGTAIIYFDVAGLAWDESTKWLYATHQAESSLRAPISKLTVVTEVPCSSNKICSGTSVAAYDSVRGFVSIEKIYSNDMGYFGSSDYRDYRNILKLDPIVSRYQNVCIGSRIVFNDAKLAQSIGKVSFLSRAGQVQVMFEDSEINRVFDLKKDAYSIVLPDGCEGK